MRSPPEQPPATEPLAPVPAPAPQPGPARRSAPVGFYVLLALAVGLMVYLCWPFLVPLFLAAVLAAALMPLQSRLSKGLRGHERVAAALLSLAVLVLIVSPLATVGGVLVHQALAGLDAARRWLGIRSISELRVGALPPNAESAVTRAFAFVHLDRSQLETVLSHAREVAQHAAPKALEEGGRALFHSLLMLLALYFFLAEGNRVVRWLLQVAPLQERQTRTLLDEFRKVSRAAILGTLATAVLQGGLAAIGFEIFKVPNPLFLGLLVGLASFVPVVGTALVWVPAGAWLWISGSHAAAIGLAAFCGVLVVGAEHVAKPLFVRGQVEMHTGLVFLSILGGLEMFGLIGILAGPLIVAFFLAMTRMYAQEFRGIRRAELH